MTEYERKFAQLTPEQQKQVKEAVGEMMGMPPAPKNKPAKKPGAKKKK